MQNDSREAYAVLLLVYSYPPGDPVEAVCFACRPRMRNHQMSNIGVTPHHLLDLALCFGVVYVSADEHVKIPVVYVADCVQQRASDDISFLPSREHQCKWLLGPL